MNLSCGPHNSFTAKENLGLSTKTPLTEGATGRKEIRMETITRFLSDEKGTETVEWAIMIGLIAFTTIATCIAISKLVEARFTTLSNAVQGQGAS